MKIVVVSHDTFWPLRGGGGIRVFWAVRKMIERKHQVMVIAPFLSTDGLENVFPGIDVKNLGRVTRFVKFKEGVYMLLMLKIFIKLLFAKFDVIYAHNVVAGFPSLLIAKLKRKPIVFDLDDILTGYSRNKIVNKVGPAVDYFTARYTDMTIVMSDYLEGQLKRKKINHFKKVPHGVNLSLFRPEKADREFIIYTGGIEPNDGTLLVPEVAKKVLKKYPSEKFLFIGEGKFYESLKRRVREDHLEDSFIFKGWIEHEKIPYYLARSKIGLVTSERSVATEASSTLRAYEYMAMELPVVIPDLDGMSEQVGNGSRGLVFKCGDADDLSDKIMQLLADKSLLEKLGRAGRKYVEANCDWDKNALSIVKLCENYQNN